MSSVFLEVDGLARAFGATKALTACTFQAHGGTVHALLGENGSGKSTAVKILSGVLAPDRGSIRFAGQLVTKFAPALARARGVATVFQDLLNVPTRSVVDNILLGEPGWVRGSRTRRQRAAATQRQLARLGLEDLPLDAPVGGLPLAVQQLVAVARALAREPRLLILDEATSALDVETRDRLFQVVRHELARDVLVLLITHRIDEIIQLADAVTVLRNGETAASLEKADIDEANLMSAMLLPGVPVHA